MAIAITVDGVAPTTILGVPDTTAKEAIYQGTLTFSGSYVTGGDVLSFGNSAILSNTAPNHVEVYEEPTTSQTATNYRFIYTKGSTIANGELQIFVGTTGAQLAAGAYGSLFSSTIVKFRAWFPRGF